MMEQAPMAYNNHIKIKNDDAVTTHTTKKCYQRTYGAMLFAFYIEWNVCL